MSELKNRIPTLPIGGEPVCDCNDGAELYLFYNKTKQDFLDYVESAKSVGFEMFDETEYGENFYATMKNDDLCLHIYYVASENALRIVADPFTDLYNCVPEQAEKRCETTLWQFEVDHSLIDCGMCYIIRCCDNSFFIIDSAHPYSIHDNDRIYKFLRERTPKGEKIRIAGWFISHAHDDHIGKFADFLKYNCDDVEIESVYYNFIPTNHRDSWNWMESNKVMQRNCEELLKSFDVKKIKLHSGQHFFVKNLEFRVLCTHEDVYPKDNTNFNDSSVVIIMQAEDTTVLFPGDAGHVESDICTERFGELLKCDIVQAAHHGHFGTKEDFYFFAAAKTILFPVTQIFFDEDFETRDVNRYAIDLADEYYIASNGTVELNLPYKVGQAAKHPDETFEDFEGIYNLWAYEYTTERKEQLRRQFIENGGNPNNIK